jgi:hypothetical protein
VVASAPDAGTSAVLTGGSTVGGAVDSVAAVGRVTTWPVRFPVCAS